MQQLDRENCTTNLKEHDKDRIAYVHAKSEVHAIIDRYIDMIETQSATEV